MGIFGAIDAQAHIYSFLQPPPPVRSVKLLFNMSVTLPRQDIMNTKGTRTRYLCSTLFNYWRDEGANVFQRGSYQGMHVAFLVLRL